MKTIYTPQSIFQTIQPISAGNEITEDQIKIARDVCSGTRALETSLVKGNYGEIVEDLLILGAGFSSMHSRISTLTARTHLGIDGVYHKSLRSRNLYIVADAKFGSSRLSTTRTGRQLSDMWIDYRLNNGLETSPSSERSTRLEAAIGKFYAYKAIKDINAHRAVLIKLLVHISPDLTVSMHIVDGNGYVTQRYVSFQDITTFATSYYK